MSKQEKIWPELFAHAAKKIMREDPYNQNMRQYTYTYLVGWCKRPDLVKK